MRSYVCIAHEGVPYKLMWFNEDSQGVYAGIYGAMSGAHFSYHADGTKHFKKGPRVLQQQGVATPVKSIESFHQWFFGAYPLSPSTMYVAAETYNHEDRSSPVAIFLDGGLFVGDCFAIDAYVLHRAKEQEFVRYLYSRGETTPYKIVTCNMLTLRHFPMHKLGLVLLTGEGVLGD